MKNNSISFLILFIFISLISCSRDKGKLFTSLSNKRTGIEFKNLITDSESFNVLDYGYLYNGGGVAVGASCILIKVISGLKI
jgi:hypothetical protein